MKKGQKIDKRPLIDKFWEQVSKEEGCWLWKGRKNIGGYGTLYHKGQLIASRISYELHYGPFNPQLLVCHKCDAPSCVNPEHLFLGTALDNHRDMVEKGRRNNHTNTNYSTTLLPWIESKRKPCQVLKGLAPGIYVSILEAAKANKTNGSYLSKIAKGKINSATFDVIYL